MPNGDTEVLSFDGSGRMSRYNSTSPIGAFQWPMDTMRREQREQAMTYDDVLARWTLLVSLILQK